MKLAWSVPNTSRNVLAWAPPRQPSPDGWSGYGGVAINGSPAGSATVAGFPSRLAPHTGDDRNPDPSNRLLRWDARTGRRLGRVAGLELTRTEWRTEIPQREYAPACAGR